MPFGCALPPAACRGAESRGFILSSGITPSLSSSLVFSCPYGASEAHWWKQDIYSRSLHWNQVLSLCSVCNTLKPTRSSSLLCKLQPETLLVIMYIVDTSRNLQQGEVGAVQAQTLHWVLWPGLLALSPFPVSSITIQRQLWTAWCEGTQADSESVERHFCVSALDLLHLCCLHSAHMQKWFSLRLDNLPGDNGKEAKNAQST